MLTIDNVTKKYIGTTALNKVSLSIAPNKTYALLGPNGSGKSTLMKLIAGLTMPTKGSITIDGYPLIPADKARIAYMPTESYFFNYMTPIDAAKYYMDFFPDFDYEKYINLLRQMELPASKKIRHMSSGMMAKMKIAINLARNSSIIMLDEPLNGIDIIAREQVTNVISNGCPEGASIIVSSHLVDELEKIVDAVIFLKNGQLVLADDIANIREKTDKTLVELYKEIYGGGGYMPC